MSNKNPKTRLYVSDPLKAGAVILIDSNQGHHLVNVMRIKMAEYVSLFNGSEGEWLGEITKVGKGKAMVTAREKIAEQSHEPDLWYLFAPLKKARVDYMMQKATELGVSVISPVMTARTNLDKLKIEKLKASAFEAAEQCGRMSVPSINDIISLDDMLKSWPEDRALIFCDEVGDAVPMKDLTSEFDKWAVIIGPEGGFTEEERKKIKDHRNTLPVTLGPRILRADTAAVTAISLWQSFFGDWKQ
ncbi:MAG: 16S rRNA (uracil(1498)-N(3))-methyltransferase [Kordiimonadaceae bacterium]|nr:16S rRNA (uracil(1498)-N(3))-methyltransferase [Kordiimonadaceae bacterium]MBT6032075.1 16S rRNA (uracil(1498)-N(3))-methyltransferase [Kordiimonadaceae bacterium]